ncbi:MAG: repair protein RadC [Bacteroidota bacterium]|jgi:DNA repair protein RadC
MEKLTVKAWSEEDRPREKFIAKGRHSLSDAELIAILLGSGSREETAVELARRLLLECGNDLHTLGRLPLKKLTEFHGIGSAKAVTLMAAIELGRRRREATPETLKKITCSEDAAAILQPLLEDLNHEEFWVLFLNRANLMIAREQISKGGISGTVADPRIIFQTALQHKSTGIILCHNHPSGNLKPSEADLRLTKNLTAAGKVLEITVLDHIIISTSGYYSFADDGKL